ncbi:hypothetical protein GCM10009712_44200 [Pseudarthrobacter sulfonivorans]
MSIGVSSELLTFERDNRECFAEGVPDRGDEYFSRFQARHQELLDEQSAGDRFLVCAFARARVTDHHGDDTLADNGSQRVLERSGFGKVAGSPATVLRNGVEYEIVHYALDLNSHG